MQAIEELERSRSAGKEETKGEMAFRKIHAFYIRRLEKLVQNATHPILILEEKKKAEQTLAWAKSLNPNANIEVIQTWHRFGAPKKPIELVEYFQRHGIKRAIIGGSQALFKEENPETSEGTLMQYGKRFFGHRIRVRGCVGVANFAIKALTSAETRVMPAITFPLNLNQWNITRKGKKIRKRV